MENKDIERTIKELCRQNMNAYPGQYQIFEGCPHFYAVDKARNYAIDMWDNRTYDERMRDLALKLTITDYILWCLEELDKFVYETGTSV